MPIIVVLTLNWDLQAIALTEGMHLQLSDRRLSARRLPLGTINHELRLVTTTTFVRMVHTRHLEQAPALPALYPVPLTRARVVSRAVRRVHIPVRLASVYLLQ
jgi:hypothetical protein